LKEKNVFNPVVTLHAFRSQIRYRISVKRRRVAKKFIWIFRKLICPTRTRFDKCWRIEV